MVGSIGALRIGAPRGCQAALRGVEIVACDRAGRGTIERAGWQSIGRTPTMAHQLSRPALAMRGRRGLWSLCLRHSSIVCTPSHGVAAGCPHPSPPPAKPGEGMYFSTPLPSTPLGEGWDGGQRHLLRSFRRAGTTLLATFMLALPAALHAQVKDGVPPPKHKWTKFVTVAGQPEPVPAEWVATPEGQFAHSIVIPNPVPKDSGYRWWWSAKKYFLHLCEKEAGEFVFKTAENVEGFLFMRPPSIPTDFDLMDQYKLEAPGLERLFRAYSGEISARGTGFVSPGRNYWYFEEPAPTGRKDGVKFLKSSDYDPKVLRLTNTVSEMAPSSRYAVTWRGLRRVEDRKHRISGFEVIVVDTESNEVLAVWREFDLSGKAAEGKSNVWWLTAEICPKAYSKYKRPEIHQKYGFISSVLKPPSLARTP
jgi:hypothetical protein